MNKRTKQQPQLLVESLIIHLEDNLERLTQIDKTLLIVRSSLIYMESVLGELKETDDG